MKLRHILRLLAVVGISALSSAQVDPRERYGTYLGGSNTDCFDMFLDNCPTVGHNYSPASTSSTAVMIDKSGFIYVAGMTDAVDFPTTPSAYRRTVHYADNSFGDQVSADSFLTKFTPAGALVWSTYLGLNAKVLAIGFDSSGNINLVGDVNTGFTSRYPFDTPFILKLNPTATTVLSYKQLLKDGICDNGYGTPSFAAAFDKWGSVYIVGQEYYSQDCFPATPGANQSGSGFVVKLSSAGSQLYAARLDSPGGVVADGNNNAYIAGSYGGDLNPGPYAVELNATGAVVFSKYLGTAGGYWGTGNGIRLASNGDVILTGTGLDGSVQSTANFGTSPWPRQTAETFVARVRVPSGNLIYSVVIHDPNLGPAALALDSADEAFVTGAMYNSTTFSVNRYLKAPSGGAFLVRLNQAGTAFWLDSTFGGDTANAIAVDAAWNAWVVGTSKSGEYFPITGTPYQSSFKGAASQGFLAKLIVEADVKITAGASPNPVTANNNVTYTFSVLNNGPDVSDGDTLTDVLPNGTTFVSFSNTNGSCTHPAVASGGVFKCTRSVPLLKAHAWGPITLTVHFNAASGNTITNTASVAAKTQDVSLSNNSATVSVHVQ